MDKHLDALFRGTDRVLISWMKHHGPKFLRYSMAVIFIWFGYLKTIGFSPATELVAKTVYWFNPSWFVPFLGWWEVAIGVCFLFRPLLRFGILILVPQMAGTFLPLVLLPSITWNGILLPTLEGQYIIKNLVLISAALVIGSHIHDKDL